MAKGELTLEKRGKRKDVDMTQGDILRHIVVFALPLLAGNVFQQLYNMVDTIVVGQFVSNKAFAAVGSVGPIINTLIGLFLGFSSGAGVVVSQYYGAKQGENVKKTVHTSILVTLILVVIFTAVGILITPLSLKMMKLEEGTLVFEEAKSYLTIYFAGVIGLMIYNIGSGILRAVGDSKRPFIYLVVSAVLNTILDLVFVLVFGMGVEGVAYATIIAQFVSAVLVMISLMRAKSSVRFSFKDMKIDLDMLKKILSVGLPASLQMAITSFSNIFVQSYINYFDTSCMGGWTAYSKVDQFILLPMQSVSLAATTFVGQNLGVGNEKRARQGARISLLLAMISTVVLTIIVEIFAPSLVMLFNTDSEVVEYGSMFLRWLSPFYVLCCINQIYSGVLRGAGNSKVPMFIMLGSFVVFRQIYLFVMSNYIANEALPIALGYPAGWLVCSVIIFIYYRKCSLIRSSVVEGIENLSGSDADKDEE